MHKLFHFYNQNRKRIWIIAIVIVFGFAIIQILNQFSIEKNKRSFSDHTENKINTEKTYEEESKSIVSGGTVSKTYSKDFGKVIDEFFTYCINEQPQKAYDLLSSACKEELYPSEAIFREQYYQKIFNQKKTYSFQSWTSGRAYIYLVKIFDNMLATGKDNSDKYIQDYVTLVKEKEDYKLNINSFVAKQEIGKQKEKNGVTIKVQNSNIFMEEQIYVTKITNHTDKTILIAPTDKLNAIYIVDENNISFSCALNEILQEDLMVEPGKSKTIKFKFNNSYRDSVKIDKIVFSNIIRDYSIYQNDPKNENVMYDIAINF